MFGLLNNIYFNYQLSSFLVPLGTILYLFYEKSRPYLMYGLIYIAIIGTIDTLFLKNEIVKAGNKDGNNYGHIQYYLFLFFHICLLFPLFEFKKYGYPNIQSFIIFIIAILVISFLPYWPYYLSREVFIYVLICTYIALTGTHYLLAIR